VDFCTKELPKDCLLVSVQKFKYKVRLVVCQADIGRDNCLCGIPVMHAKLEGKISALILHVCSDKQVPD
jgi:hypothetical protein